MNSLEDQIRALPVRTPSESLDTKIQALLNAPSAEPERAADQRLAWPAGQRCPSDDGPVETRIPGPPLQTPRRVNGHRRGPASAAGPVAAVSLVAGFLAGQVLPRELSPVWSRADMTQTRFAGADHSITAVSGDSGTATSTDLPVGEPPASHFRVNSRSAVTVASRMADLWELGSGQKFDVERHIDDRRFDGCRDCHQSGG